MRDLNNPSTYGILTAGHCIDYAVMYGGKVYQPDFGENNLIGKPVRYISDAGLIKLYVDWFPGVYLPWWPYEAPIIGKRSPVVGEEEYMIVGARTIIDENSVIMAKVKGRLAWNQGVILLKIEPDYPEPRAGDSGAPIIAYYSDNTAEAVGIFNGQMSTGDYCGMDIIYVEENLHVSVEEW